MKIRLRSASLAAILGAASLPFAWAGAHAAAPLNEAEVRATAHDILKQLIETNTSDSIGSTTLAARAMAQRLREAGFPESDVTVLGPNERKGNLVVRYRAKPGSRLRPILIIAHTDVVEARREDWTTDPFGFVEKDGYYYGRGTQDMKDSVAIAVTDFIRFKREGYVPDRDIILALTADEEGGQSNGVAWLLATHRDLIDAEYALNPDSGGVVSEHGKALSMELGATEKLYADFRLTATNPGGHSSLPKPDNAIYHVVDALARLQNTPFPFELNDITREYFKQTSTIETGEAAGDMRAILRATPDPAAIERLSRDARYNSLMRTTCVATMMSAGHAPNALPQHAEANVNCRIIPGYSQEDIRVQLVTLFDDAGLSVRYVSDAGAVADHGSDRKSLAPSPVLPEVMQALRGVTARLWPGIPVMPMMMTWSSDSVYTMGAGIPSYGVNGVAIDRDDVRMHGKDERVPIAAYYQGVEFYYQFLKALTSRGH